jgi:hypothetical protein
MEYVVGVILGIGIGIFSTVVGLDRDRALYPVALIVIASYYCLYAVLGGSNTALVNESIIATLFVVIAAVGFRTNLWIVAAGIVGHGVMDIFHHLFIENPGLPTWWPMFCMSIDIVIGAYMALMLWRKGIPTTMI